MRWIIIILCSKTISLMTRACVVHFSNEKHNKRTSKPNNLTLNNMCAIFSFFFSNTLFRLLSRIFFYEIILIFRSVIAHGFIRFDNCSSTVVHSVISSWIPDNGHLIYYNMCAYACIACKICYGYVCAYVCVYV